MKRILLFAFVLITSISLVSQSDQEMQEKYWKYRDQLKKYFMKIGPERGESIPCRNRVIGWMQDFNNPAGSRMRWTDATIDVGYYLVLLATEYRLLAEHGQSTTSTENELYYALNAVNRVDLVAEEYLSDDNAAPSLNGFYGVYQCFQTLASDQRDLGHR